MVPVLSSSVMLLLPALVLTTVNFPDSTPVDSELEEQTFLYFSLQCATLWEPHPDLVEMTLHDLDFKLDTVIREDLSCHLWGKDTMFCERKSERGISSLPWGTVVVTVSWWYESVFLPTGYNFACKQLWS